jgi:hypothetical protein
LSEAIPGVISVRGKWKLLMGTGTLQGIKGEATFEELAPKMGDPSVVAIMTGGISLRAIT